MPRTSGQTARKPNKSAFFVTYSGNKWKEMPRVMEAALFDINWSQVTHFVEPFSGSAAASRYIFQNVPAFKGTFVLGDTDPGMIAFYKEVQAGRFPALVDAMHETAKATTTAAAFKAMRAAQDVSTARGWWLKNRLKGHYHANLFDAADMKRKETASAAQWQPALDFFTSGRVTCLCQDASATIDYAARLAAWRPGSVAVFLDPPYFDSFNDYKSKVEVERHIQDGVVVLPDNTTTFVDILRALQNPNMRAVAVLNNVAILRALYGGRRVVAVYPKTYSGVVKCKRTGVYYRKKTEHVVFSNGPTTVVGNKRQRTG